MEIGESPPSAAILHPQILAILERLKVKRVCDIGSGNGRLAHCLKAAGYYVVGVEYDQHGVQIAKSNYPDINFYNMGVEDDPQPLINSEAGLFDLVVSTEVIEHLFSPHLLPIFASKVLSHGGYLVVSTPYHGYLKNLALSVLNKWDKHHTSLSEGGHIKFWSRKTLTRLLEANGFKVLEFQGSGRLPWLWKSMILVARVV